MYHMFNKDSFSPVGDLRILHFLTHWPCLLFRTHGTLHTHSHFIIHQRPRRISMKISQVLFMDSLAYLEIPSLNILVASELLNCNLFPQLSETTLPSLWFPHCSLVQMVPPCKKPMQSQGFPHLFLCLSFLSYLLSNIWEQLFHIFI